MDDDLSQNQIGLFKGTHKNNVNATCSKIISQPDHDKIRVNTFVLHALGIIAQSAVTAPRVHPAKLYVDLAHLTISFLVTFLNHFPSNIFQ